MLIAWIAALLAGLALAALGSAHAIKHATAVAAGPQASFAIAAYLFLYYVLLR